MAPDVVVLGKPIGNGLPARGGGHDAPEIAEALIDNGMEFFSTFGGIPVPCAAGLAVLDVVEEERLQERALRVGRASSAGPVGLAERHPLIGDVRARAFPRRRAASDRTSPRGPGGGRLRGGPPPRTAAC